MEGRKIPLSIAIITLNEAARLPELLHSISFAEQIVVVDSGSTDDTVKVASDYGCEVHQVPWRGFGKQKQFAIDQCRNDWILVIDADERIPAKTAREIQDILESDRNSHQGFSFPRKNYFQGRWIRHMGWWPDRVVRMFRKGSGRMTEDAVHESVAVEGSVRDLEVPIIHLTESSLSEILVKINRYSTLAAEEAFQKGRRSSIGMAAFRAFLAFIHDYLLRCGFMDGSQGLVLSITDSVNKFFKYAKLSQMESRQKHEGSIDPDRKL